MSYSHRCDDEPDKDSAVAKMDNQLTGPGEGGRTYVSSKAAICGTEIVERLERMQGRGPKSWPAEEAI